jgi:PAS domain S-box-containing protein
MLDFTTALRWTVEWMKSLQVGADMRRVSESQINRFMGFAQQGKTTRSLASRGLKAQDPAQAMSPLLEHAYILDLVDETVMARGTDSRISFWNRGAEKMYGWTKEEATGRVSHTLLQTQFPQPLDSIEAELIRCSLWEGKLVHARRDGTQIEVNSRWVLNNEGQGTVATVLEINKRSG